MLCSLQIKEFYTVIDDMQALSLSSEDFFFEKSMLRTDHLQHVRIIRLMQCHRPPSAAAERSALLLFACIVLQPGVSTGIPLAAVGKLRARHLFPASSLSKNKWNSFCYYLHV